MLKDQHMPFIGLCDELITRPGESYRLWCVVVCDLETSSMRRPWPTGGCRTKNKNICLWYCGCNFIACHQYVSAAYVAIFRVVTAVHYTDCITAHQSGSQFTTYIFYVHHSTHSKHQFSTSDIQY